MIEEKSKRIEAEKKLMLKLLGLPVKRKVDTTLGSSWRICRRSWPRKAGRMNIKTARISQARRQALRPRLISMCRNYIMPRCAI